MHVRRVVPERIVPNSQVQEALAAPLEVVQAMTQAGPSAFHRVAVYTGPVRVTTSGRACAMVHRPMVIVSLGAMVEVICIGEERRPGCSRGGHDGCDRRGAYVLEHCERHARLARPGLPWRGVAPSPGWVDGPSRCAFVAFDCTGQSLAACTLVACIRFHVVLQLAGRLQMVRLVDATIQSIDPPLRGALLDISGGGNVCGVQLQRPQADHQQPFQGASLAFLEDRPGPVRAHGTGWPQRTAQCPQLQRCSPLSHRARDSTASLLQRGHVMPSGQRKCRKKVIGVLQWNWSNHIIPLLRG